MTTLVILTGLPKNSAEQESVAPTRTCSEFVNFTSRYLYGTSHPTAVILITAFGEAGAGTTVSLNACSRLKRMRAHGFGGEYSSRGWFLPNCLRELRTWLLVRRNGNG